MSNKEVADMLKQIKANAPKEYEKLVGKIQKLASEHPKKPPVTP